MKFPIRFADQIVGTLIIVAVGIVIFAIFMIGSNQRWFSRDYSFITYFPSATGLSRNMAVQYKGFTIGRVKSIELANDDQVEVRFIIFDTYIDRVRKGSLVEVITSPIGALGGSQFLFHPGRGNDLVSEGGTIPAVNSAEARQMLAEGLAVQPEIDDDINKIISMAGELLATLDEAFKGSGDTSLGRTMRDVETVIADMRPLPSDLKDILDELRVQLDPILTNLRDLSEMIADPDSSVTALLDAEGNVYKDLSVSLNSLSGILRNLERTSDFIPTQLPQVAQTLSELQSSLAVAEDVLISLTNNPLLRGGLPERRETNTGGAHPRDLEF
ncbi:MAG: MlaD family protein [Treponema sp.]|jgi:phospholipid/cholesterol/gamma-HCH transport system substrate-binding protein|nr:MlaD family protein [Treponema sp.]